MPPSGLTMGKSARKVAAAAEGRSCNTCPMAICAFMVGVRSRGNSLGQRNSSIPRGETGSASRMDPRGNIFTTGSTGTTGEGSATLGLRLPCKPLCSLRSRFQWELLLQIRVAFDAGVLLYRFRSWLVIEGNGTRRDHAVLFAVQIGDRVARDRVVAVPA